MNHESPYKVLVADDDEELLGLLQRALAIDHYEVVVARDGMEAVERTLALGPDLVILDVEMPGPDGFEVCRRLRGDPRTHGVPVIMLTSRGTEKDVLQGFAGGAQDYLTKPFGIAQLRARVKMWLMRGTGPMR